MTIKLRFALLLAALLLAFLLALALLQHAERAEHRRLLETYRRDRAETLERWLELSGQTVRQFANDYSLWDEMVEFVARPTEDWARINLDASLATFDADALWVLRPDGTLVYAKDRLGIAPIPPPLEADALHAATAARPFPWFFAASPAGLLEIRGAPIQPSDDMERTRPPTGWFLVARLWDAAHLAYLGRLTESQATLRQPGEPAPAAADAPARVALARPLDDWRGQPLRVLHVARESPELAQQLETDAHEAQTLKEAVDALIELLRTAAPIEFRLDLDEATADWLTPATFGIASAIVALQAGFKRWTSRAARPSPRNGCRAKMENLRLQSWTDVAAQTGTTAVDVTTLVPDAAQAHALGSPFAFTRTISDAAPRSGRRRRLPLPGRERRAQRQQREHARDRARRERRARRVDVRR